MPTEVQILEGLEAVGIPEGVEAIRIPEQKVYDGKPFPLVLVPSSDFADRDREFWQEWIKSNIKALTALVYQYAGILFRQFPIEEPLDFDLFSKAFGWEEIPYLGSYSVRKHVVGNVYTSTESAPDQFIQYHHEMAHMKDIAEFIFFPCNTPAVEGGETPIVLSNVIYERMSELEPEFVKRLAEEGLVYLRETAETVDLTNYYAQGWKKAFFSETKEDAEAKARAAGLKVEWLPGNTMRTTTPPRPAIRTHKVTGKKLWFNHVLIAYPGKVNPLTNPNDLMNTVTFPNGDNLAESYVDNAIKVANEEAVFFKWQKRDTLLLDNMQVLHGRNRVTPPRVTYASLFK